MLPLWLWVLFLSPLLSQLTLLVNGDLLSAMQDQALPFTVAFDDADGEGIVFFGNYFSLVHRAFEQWLPRQGIAWEEWFKSPVFGVPLRHVEADYLHPLRPGQEFLVSIALIEVGHHSVHFEYEMKSRENRPLARLKTSHVFVDRKDMRKMEIPAELKARLLKMQSAPRPS